MKNIKNINVTTSTYSNSIACITFHDDLIITLNLSDEATKEIKKIAEKDVMSTMNERFGFDSN